MRCSARRAKPCICWTCACGKRGALPRPVSEANGERVGVRGNCRRCARSTPSPERDCGSSLSPSPRKRGEGTVNATAPAGTHFAGRGHERLANPAAVTLLERRLGAAQAFDRGAVLLRLQAALALAHAR